MLKTLSPAELTVPDALVGWLSSGVNGRNDAQFDTEATPELAQRFSELYKHRFQIKSDDLRVVDEDAVCGDEA